MVNSKGFCTRYYDKCFTFNVAGISCFADHQRLLYLLALTNSKIVEYLAEMLNPTINSNGGDIEKIPVIISNENVLTETVKQNIALCKKDWDRSETSWNFVRNELVSYEFANKIGNLETIVGKCRESREQERRQLKENEEKINETLIEAYSLLGEITGKVSEDNLSIRQFDEIQAVKDMIMYAVGCMFGRYSLSSDGVIFAGGEWESGDYHEYEPDEDNIIPITDEEYFEDDMVGLFCDWLKKVFGVDSIEKNLDYIAKILGNKGDNTHDVLRNYFMNEFYKDHCNLYSITGSGKRPVYWLFDSGKQNGFKALVYLHRYDKDTVGRVRTDYLHKTQKSIEQAMQRAQYTLDNSKSSMEKSKATKRISKYIKQLAEIRLYDEAIAHIANQRIALDLDDGVKVNYAKFQGVEVSREGMKTVKVDLLAKI